MSRRSHRRLNFASAGYQAGTDDCRLTHNSVDVFCAARGSVAKVATRKLTQLEAAATLEFLKSPPGNHLEALAGDRMGQHSIRINKQWRICFRWTRAGPEDVEIADYH